MSRKEFADTTVQAYCFSRSQILFIELLVDAF